MIFYNARELIDAETRSHIYYIGIGGEAQVNKHGLGDAQNYAFNLDLVPFLGYLNPLRWGSYGFPQKIKVDKISHSLENYFMRLK